jgi:hypothetical protein
VLGGHYSGVYTDTIYRLRSNTGIWYFDGRLQRPTIKSVDPLKVGNLVYLAGADSYAPTTVNPIQLLILDEGENIITQKTRREFDADNENKYHYC